MVAIDPGREKIGYAIFRDRRLEERGGFRVTQIDHWGKIFEEADRIVLGKGTGWKVFYKIMKERGLENKIVLVEERGSTEEARRRYFQETNGKGLIWFIRKLLNLPGCPVDDIAAQIIGERFLQSFQPYPKNS